MGFPNPKTKMGCVQATNKGTNIFILGRRRKSCFFNYFWTGHL